MRQAKDLPFLPKIKLYLIEKQAFAQGVAYSTNCQTHLLNIPAKLMSIFPEEEMDFVRWAQKRDPRVSSDAFLPRMSYAEYLAERLKEAENSQIAYCTSERVFDEAISLEKSGNKYLIQLRSGKKICADYAVLAMGNFPPKNLPFNDERFFKSSLYVRDPWKIGEISQEAEVLIAGTGLTMVDKVLELHAKDHRAKIHAISRHGFLPQVHHLDLACLSLGNLPSPQNFRSSEVLRLLRDEIGKAHHRGIDPIRVVYTILRYLQKNLTIIPRHELDRLARHVQAHYNIYAQPVPEKINAVLQMLIEKKQLHIHAGYLSSIHEEKGRAVVKFRPRQQIATQTLHVDLVINAFGPAVHPQDVEEPLYCDLLDKGWIRPTDRNLLLETRFIFNVINKHGREEEGLFAIGSLKKRPLHTTISVPFLSVEAKLLAHRLLQMASLR